MFLLLLFFGHCFAYVTILCDSDMFDLLLVLSDTLAHTTLFVLDLQVNEQI